MNKGSPARLRRLAGVFAVLLAGATACAPVRTVVVPAPAPRCLDDAGAPVSWNRPAEDRPALDAWCSSVGPAVVMSRPSPVDRPVSRLLVISWNVHVGGGRVDELTALTRLRSGQLGSDTGLVLLLQETFRRGALVGAAPRGAPIPDAIRPSRRGDDVVRLADRLGLSAFYVPSMRNGGSDDPAGWEDRGSAILSTEPLSDLAAIELPLARQRRVAVMATVTPRNAKAAKMRLVVAHFDVVPFGGGAVRQARYLADQLTVLHDSGLPLIIGADANATSGFRHGTVTALATIAPVLRQCGTGRTSTWFARSDFIFSDLDESAIAACETFGDRYGSDHRPIVATIDLPAS